MDIGGLDESLSQASQSTTPTSQGTPKKRKGRPKKKEGSNEERTMKGKESIDMIDDDIQDDVSENRAKMKMPDFKKFKGVASMTKKEHVEISKPYDPTDATKNHLKSLPSSNRRSLKIVMKTDDNKSIPTHSVHLNSRKSSSNMNSAIELSDDSSNAFTHNSTSPLVNDLPSNTSNTNKRMCYEQILPSSEIDPISCDEESMDQIRLHHDGSNTAQVLHESNSATTQTRQKTQRNTFDIPSDVSSESSDNAVSEFEENTPKKISSSQKRKSSQSSRNSMIPDDDNDFNNNSFQISSTCKKLSDSASKRLRKPKSVIDRKTKKAIEFELPEPVKNLFGDSSGKYQEAPANALHPLLNESLDTNDVDEFTIPCPVDPNCSARLPKRYSMPISNALRKYGKMKKAFKAGNVTEEQLINQRTAFCRMHEAELRIIPEGIDKGYRNNIDFQVEVPEKIKNMQQDFVDVLLNRRHSVFREAILESFRQLGRFKARSGENTFAQLKRVQCGYYGWRGNNVAFKTIQSLFSESKSELNSTNTTPQTVTDYIQTVLVPEAVLRLIAFDFSLDLDNAVDAAKARLIMDESAEFGDVVNGSIDNDEEDANEFDAIF